MRAKPNWAWFSLSHDNRWSNTTEPLVKSVLKTPYCESFLVWDLCQSDLWRRSLWRWSSVSICDVKKVPSFLRNGGKQLCDRSGHDSWETNLHQISNTEITHYDCFRASSCCFNISNKHQKQSEKQCGHLLAENGTNHLDGCFDRSERWVKTRLDFNWQWLAGLPVCVFVPHFRCEQNINLL